MRAETGRVIVSVDGQAVDDTNAFDYRFATKVLGAARNSGLARRSRNDAALPADRARNTGE